MDNRPSLTIFQYPCMMLGQGLHMKHKAAPVFNETSCLIEEVLTGGRDTMWDHFQQVFLVGPVWMEDLNKKVCWFHHHTEYTLNIWFIILMQCGSLSLSQPVKCIALPFSSIMHAPSVWGVIPFFIPPFLPLFLPRKHCVSLSPSVSLTLGGCLFNIRILPVIRWQGCTPCQISKSAILSRNVWETTKPCQVPERRTV